MCRPRWVCRGSLPPPHPAPPAPPPTLLQRHGVACPSGTAPTWTAPPSAGARLSSAALGPRGGRAPGAESSSRHVGPSRGRRGLSGTDGRARQCLLAGALICKELPLRFIIFHTRGRDVVYPRLGTAASCSVGLPCAGSCRGAELHGAGLEQARAETPACAPAQAPRDPSPRPPATGEGPRSSSNPPGIPGCLRRPLLPAAQAAGPLRTPRIQTSAPQSHGSSPFSLGPRTRSSP